MPPPASDFRKRHSSGTSGVGGVVEQERGAQAPDLAELAALDALADGAQGGRPAVARTEAMEHAGRATGHQHLGGDLCRLGERLLADHVLAGGRGGHDDLAIEDRREAGDDEIDVVGRDDATPVLLHPLVPEALGKVGREGDGSRRPRPRGAVAAASRGYSDAEDVTAPRRAPEP